MRLVVDVADDILAVAFDSLVFILTVSKTWQLYQQWREISKNWRASLTAVLLHDGLFIYQWPSLDQSLTCACSGIRYYWRVIHKNSAQHWGSFLIWIAVPKCWPLLLFASIWCVQGYLLHLSLLVYWTRSVDSKHSKSSWLKHNEATCHEICSNYQSNESLNVVETITIFQNV